jgi:hypothetical protein
MNASQRLCFYLISCFKGVYLVLSRQDAILNGMRKKQGRNASSNMSSMRKNIGANPLGENITARAVVVLSGNQSMYALLSRFSSGLLG